MHSLMDCFHLNHSVPLIFVSTHQLVVSFKNIGMHICVYKEKRNQTLRHKCGNVCAENVDNSHSNTCTKAAHWIKGIH